MRGRPKGSGGKKNIVDCNFSELKALFDGEGLIDVRIPVKRTWLEKWRIQALAQQKEISEEKKIEMSVD